MSRNIKCVIVHFTDLGRPPDLYKDIEFVNFDESFIEVVKSEDCSINYPTFNVLKVEQYSERVD